MLEEARTSARTVVGYHFYELHARIISLDESRVGETGGDVGSRAAVRFDAARKRLVRTFSCASRNELSCQAPPPPGAADLF